MLKHIPYDEPIPTGYGIAYHHPHMCVAVVAPVPLNLVVSVWMRFKWFAMRNPFAPTQKICVKCFKNGYARGRANARDERIFQAWDMRRK